MNIKEVLSKEFKTELPDRNSQPPKPGHFILKANAHLPLFSQNLTLTGSEILQQIAQMEEMKNHLTDAQDGLLRLLGQEGE